jgi:hypothetical protein
MTIQSLVSTLVLSTLAAMPLPSSASSAPACPSGDGSDLVYADGFDTPRAFTAFASDVSNDRFIAFDFLNPSSVVPVGGAGGTAFVMDFVGDDFSKVFGIDTFGAMANTFATIDTATGEITPIGVSNPSADAGGWTGLKYDRSTGVAYAVATSCGSASHLYTIDIGTGASTLIGEIQGLPCVYRIAISPDGALFGLDTVADALYSIDKTSGDATLVGPIGFDVGSDGDLDFEDSSGQLYYAGFNGDTGLEEVRTIDQSALIGQLDSGFIAGFAIAASAGACPARR